MGEYNGISTEEYEKIIRDKLPEVLSYVAEYGMDSSYTKARIADLYQDIQGYKFSINQKRFVEDYPVEMWDAYDQCIKNFDPDAGDFLHYYNRTLSLMCSKAKSQNDGAEKRRGINGISSAMFGRCKKIRQYCDENGISEPSQKDIRNISELYGNGTKKDIYKWIAAYQMFKNTYVMSSSYQGNDDERDNFDAYSYRNSEGYSKYNDDEWEDIKNSDDELYEESSEDVDSDYDLCSSYSYNDDGEVNYDDDGGYSDSMDEIGANMGDIGGYSGQGVQKPSAMFEKMCKVYSGLQKRTQMKVSAVLTYEMCKTVPEEQLKTLLKYEFVNSEIVNRFLTDGRVLTQKELSSLMGIKEESLSRTMSEFKARVEEE